MEDANRIKVVLVEKAYGKWCTGSSRPDLACFLKIADLLEVDLKELFVKGSSNTFFHRNQIMWLLNPNKDTNRHTMVTKYQNTVDIIKTAILQSQARAAKTINQEQLALYYGIGRYVSANLSVATDVITKINTFVNSAVVTDDFTDDAEIHYAGYIMQDFRQPMGVATYKTADEMDPELLKALPPKEELQRVFVESNKKDE